MRTLLFLTLLFWSANCVAQLKSTDSLQIRKIENSKYLKGLYLRKSAKSFISNSSIEEIKDGAIISMNVPKEGPTSFSINAAGIYDIRSESPDQYRVKSVSLYTQYDRNNLIDSEQHNIQAGVIIRDNFLKEFNNNKTNSFFPEVALSSSFRKDLENNFDAIQSRLILNPFVLNFKIDSKGTTEKEDDSYYYSTSPLSPSNLIGNNQISFIYALELGIEYDYRFNGESSLLDGNLLRSFSQITLDLYLFQCVDLGIEWQYRYNLWNTTDLNSSDFSYLTAKINLTPKFTNLNFLSPSIGLQYVNGENPSTGFNKQSYYALNLSLKIN